MSITTTSSLPAPVQQSFSYKLLAVPVPNMIHKLGAMLYRMPRNGGSILRMRRYNPLNTATVPLGNSGISPPPQSQTAVDIDARIDFYGTYVYINEQVTLQNQDPVLNQTTERLGVSLRQTEDELMRNMLASTASFVNCTGGTNGDNPTNPTRNDVDTVVSLLANNDAQTLSMMIEGENKFGTAPVRDAYMALGSSQLIPTLSQVNGFIAKAQYPGQMSVLREEFGSIGNVRYFLSSIGSVSANASALGNDVFNVFTLGIEAYAAIEQDGYSAQFIYRPPIYDGPLALNASLGWKMAEVPRLTNDAWLFNHRMTKAS